MHQLNLFKGKRQRGVRPPAALEFRTHCAIADALRVGKAPGWLWFHPANGELRDKAAAAKLLRMGVLAGCSDFILSGPPEGRLHAMELKRRGRRPTDEQERFLEAVRAAGGKAEWVDGFDQAIELLKGWGALRLTVSA